MKEYGQKRPPIYDFSKINIPVLVYCAEGDQLSSLEDNLLLKSHLKNSYLWRFEKFGHFFIFIGLKPEIYINKILDDINNNAYKDEYIPYE